MQVEVEDLSQARIAAVLNQMRLHFSVQEGVCTAGFALAEGLDATLIVDAEGRDGDVLLVRAFAHREFAPEKWPSLLAAINNWHRSFRWPRGYVDFLDEGAAPPVGVLVAEHQQPLSAGVHDEALRLTIATAVDSSMRFLKGVVEQVCPPDDAVTTADAETLESWLD